MHVCVYFFNKKSMLTPKQSIYQGEIYFIICSADMVMPVISTS